MAESTNGPRGPTKGTRMCRFVAWYRVRPGGPILDRTGTQVVYCTIGERFRPASTGTRRTMSLQSKSRSEGPGNSQFAADYQWAARTLASRDISPTPQRVEIARILLARPQHLCAEQVLSALKQGDLTVSKATVYNTLGLFTEKGLVREVIVDPSKVFYDSNCSDHHHIYDVDSCTLTDIDARKIAIDGLPDVPQEKVVERVDVIVRVRSRSD